MYKSAFYSAKKEKIAEVQCAMGFCLLNSPNGIEIEYDINNVGLIIFLFIGEHPKTKKLRIVCFLSLE